jgi:cysteinyl-tRNA synthetase
MSYELLGDTFDIHGGGNDLMFPHHENEIAQSCCANGDDSFAKVWLHNEMLQVEGKKMSKSLGNFFTVRDLLEQGVPGEVIRFVFLSTHYRKPMDWTDKKAKDAEATLRKWRALTAGIEPAANAAAEVVGALSDDLNTAGVITELHKLAAAGDAAGLLASGQLVGLLSAKAGDWTQTADVDLSAFEAKLSKARSIAMETKDFSEVDRLKAGFVEAGLEVRMSKAGVELVPGSDFDPAKLEGL